MGAVSFCLCDLVDVLVVQHRGGLECLGYLSTRCDNSLRALGVALPIGGLVRVIKGDVIGQPGGPVSRHSERKLGALLRFCLRCRPCSAQYVLHVQPKNCTVIASTLTDEEVSVKQLLPGFWCPLLAASFPLCASFDFCFMCRIESDRIESNPELFYPRAGPCFNTPRKTCLAGCRRAGKRRRRRRRRGLRERAWHAPPPTLR